MRRAAPLRVHVVGCAPRSGTTLMHALLTQAYGLAGAGDHERSLVAPPPGPGPGCTKTPHELALAAALLRGWPALHVVYLRRDPRDVITSRHRRHPQVYWTPLRIWRRNEALVQRWQAHPRVHVVRFEDLVRDGARVQADLERAIPLPPRLRDFAAYPWTASHAGTPALHAGAVEALGAIRPLADDGIGRWRNHLPRVKGQIAQHGPITADLMRLGYEANAAWERLLDGVPADLTPSHWPEHLGAAQRARLTWRRRWRVGVFVARRVFWMR